MIWLGILLSIAIVIVIATGWSLTSRTQPPSRPAPACFDDRGNPWCDRLS